MATKKKTGRRKKATGRKRGKRAGARRRRRPLAKVRLTKVGRKKVGKRKRGRWARKGRTLALRNPRNPWQTKSDTPAERKWVRSSSKRAKKAASLRRRKKDTGDLVYLTRAEAKLEDWKPARRRKRKKYKSAVARPKRRSGRKAARRGRPRKGRKYAKKFTRSRARVTLRRKGRMPSWEKKILKKRGYLTRSGKVRNPSHRRRRRNPGGLLEQLQAHYATPYLAQGAQVFLVGVPVATILPALAEAFFPQVKNRDGVGVALAAASSGIGYLAGNWLERFLTPSGGSAPLLVRNLGRNVGLGGLGVTAVRAAWWLMPKFADFLGLPTIREHDLPVVSRLHRAPPPPQVAHPAGAAGAAGMGWFYGMGQGGGMDPNEALIAGESFARSVSQFEGLGNMGDWMELKGMGDWMEMRGMGAMDPRIPMSDIRGPGQLQGYPGQYGGGSYDPYGANRLRGLGDWVEMTSGAELAKQEFSPANETF